MRGGAAGARATVATRPALAARWVSRVASRSNTWTAPALTAAAAPLPGRLSPVTHSTPSTPRAASPTISCSRATRLRSRQVSVTQGRTPASRSWAASIVGGKSARSCRSATSSASALVARRAATARRVAGSRAGTERSDRTTGRCAAVSSRPPGTTVGAGGGGPSHARTGAPSTHGHGRSSPSSHAPDGRTPPHGPNSIRFGHAVIVIGRGVPRGGRSHPGPAARSP